MIFTTPLRYPGGKTKLAQFIQIVMRENSLLGGHYVEPFAGGAGIAFALLFHEYAFHVHINDLNKFVYAFWHSVIEKTDELCKLINDTPVTVKEWGRQRAIQANPDEHSILDLGFSTFFMNRTNRSGIITAGIIGGKAQSGKWKLDARYNKEDLIARIKKIAMYKNRISIYNKDAADFIINTLPSLPRRTLVYLDPPYYHKGQELYENHYYHEDHASLARLVKKKIRQHWVVSYDNVSEVNELYNGYRQMDYKISYSAQERYKGSELFIFGPNLKIPSVVDPLKVNVA